MCYQQPRLAFDYNTKVSGMSCISITVRSSTAVSHGFNLPSHRSTPFASYPCDFGRFHTPSLACAADWSVSLRLRYNLSLATEVNSLASVSRLTHGHRSLSSLDYWSPRLDSRSVIPFMPIHSLAKWFQALFKTLLRALFNFHSRY
jgi:hypothetical protein